MGIKLHGGQKWKKVKISPLVTSPPTIFSKFQGYLSEITFVVNKAQLFGFIKKIDFGDKISIFRFLGFFEKNLKPKKFVLGGQNEKNEKSKGVFGKEMKSFGKESVLIFYLK